MIMPWIGDADTVLEVWNQGAEDGHVVAELLWGVVNPSGKVPTTYAVRREDLMEFGDPVRYPGTDEGEGWPNMRYTEGLQIGYRWFQSQGIRTLFPFGYGLSYTTFALDGFTLTPEVSDGAAPVTATVTVTNTGQRPARRSSRSTWASPSTDSLRSGSSDSGRCSWSPGSPVRLRSRSIRTPRTTRSASGTTAPAGSR